MEVPGVRKVHRSLRQRRDRSGGVGGHPENEPKWRRDPIRIPPRVATVILIAAALPTLVSVATAASGVWDATNAGRALLAVPLGMTAGVLVAAVAAKDLR